MRYGWSPLYGAYYVRFWYVLAPVTRGPVYFDHLASVEVDFRRFFLLKEPNKRDYSTSRCVNRQLTYLLRHSGSLFVYHPLQARLTGTSKYEHCTEIIDKAIRVRNALCHFDSKDENLHSCHRYLADLQHLLLVELRKDETLKRMWVGRFHERAIQLEQQVYSHQGICRKTIEVNKAEQFAATDMQIGLLKQVVTGDHESFLEALSGG